MRRPSFFGYGGLVDFFRYSPPDCTAVSSDVATALSPDACHRQISLAELERFRERIRQASMSFNLTYALIVASTAINVIGVSFLLFGKISEGTLVTSAGVASSIVSINCLRLTKETNDRLDNFVVSVIVEKSVEFD